MKKWLRDRRTEKLTDVWLTNRLTRTITDWKTDQLVDWTTNQLINLANNSSKKWINKLIVRLTNWKRDLMKN